MVLDTTRISSCPTVPVEHGGIPEVS